MKIKNSASKNGKVQIFYIEAIEPIYDFGFIEHVTGSKPVHVDREFWERYLYVREQYELMHRKLIKIAKNE